MKFQNSTEMHIWVQIVTEQIEKAQSLKAAFEFGDAAVMAFRERAEGLFAQAPQQVADPAADQASTQGLAQ